MTGQGDSAPGSAGRPEASPTGKAAVLVVDDRRENLVAFEAVLNPLGYDVVLARSGAEALEKAFRRTFAVVVMDVRMPTMGGFQTATILRKRETYRVTPIIFTSAHSVESADLATCYVAGATDFIETPAEGELLKFKVEAFVQLHFKNERLRMRAREVTEYFDSLKLEVDRGRHEAPLLARMSQLEQALRIFETELLSREIGG